MKLSNIGVIADLIWNEIKNHTKNVELGEFIVMPNHIHGILILNDNNPENVVENVAVNVAENVETRHALSLQFEINEKTIGQLRFQNQGKNSISAIVGSYKSAVTKHCNRLGFEFAWQTRFHDHVIRDALSFENIQNYITNNYTNWEKDKFYLKE